MRRSVFESLEARVVLSTASLNAGVISYNASAGETNSLTISESGGVLTFVDTGATISAGASFTVVSANEVNISTAGITVVSVNLQDMNDSVNASSVTVASGIQRFGFNGGDGNDTLIGSQLQDNFVVSAGNDQFDGQGEPTGGIDQLNASVDADMTMNDTMLNVGLNTHTYENIEIVGLTGGASDNTIDASAVTAASGIQRMGFNGGDGNDTLIGSQLQDNFALSSGNDQFDGQGEPTGGIDQLSVSADVDMTLTDTMLTVGLQIHSHTNIEIFGLNGGASDNTIDASGVTTGGGIQRVGFNGGAGDDTLIGTQMQDVFAVEEGSDSYDGQGSQAGTYDVYGVAEDADMTLTDTTLTVGAITETFVNLEQVSLVGGVSDNRFDASAVTAGGGIQLVSMSGGAGNDTLIGSAVNDSFNGGEGSDFIDGGGQVATGGVLFNGLVLEDLLIFKTSSNAVATNSTITDGTDTDTYVDIESLNLTGDAGSNTLDTSSITSVDGVTRIGLFAQAGDDTILVSGDTTIGAFVDGSLGFDTLDFAAYPIDPNVVVSGPGTLDGDAGTANGPGGINDGVVVFDNIDRILPPAFNEAPEITQLQSDATLANKALPGQTVTVSASFTDTNAGDTHVASIDWGDGTVTSGVVNQATGSISGTHQYLTGGLFTVTVVVTDGAGESDTESTSAVVTGVRLTDSGELQIVGSSSGDRIHVLRRGSNIKVRARIGGPPQVSYFQQSQVQSILVLSCEGNDHVHIDHRINAPATIDAGAGRDHVIGGGGDDFIRGGTGNDIIFGGAGNDIVLGEEGRDVMYGGWGRDILIGGLGRDWIFGGFSDDIVIGGTTDHDTNETALSAIMAEWSSNNSFATRVSNIRNGGGLNGTFVLDADTVHADGQRDYLIGWLGRDWMWSDSVDRVFAGFSDLVEVDDT